MNLPKSLRNIYWSSPNGSFEVTERFKSLLKRFVQLPKTTRPKTFFEISGNPHYEIYCSNFLKFWFSQGADHGFGDNILFSLLSLVEPNLERESLKNAEVFREDLTKNDGQLDLVIRSEDLVVGIENKIYASLQNNLEDYSQHLAKSGKRCLKIILCLNELRLEEKEKAKKSGFKIVTYDQFFKHLLNSIGVKMTTANMHYVGLLLDFVATMENLKRGTHMNVELLAFFKEYEEEIRQLCFDAVPELTSDLKAKGEPVRDLMKERKLPNGISQLKGEECSDALGRKVFSYAVWCKADLGGSHSMGLEATVQLNGWKIVAWADEESRIRVDEFIRKIGIPYKKERQENRDEIWIFKKFPYEANHEVVAKEFQELVEKVSSRLPKKKGNLKRR